MSKAKEIIVKPISSKDAARIVKSCHYSGKVVQNSQLHFGVFLDGKCGGAMQFGPSLDKRKIQGLVRDTSWNGFIELNRMAFADWLPRNSESRAISVAMRIIRKTYPHIEWVISFADGAQCGDGTIYRASGFYLTAIKKNNQMWIAPTGEKFSRMSLTDGKSKQQQQQAQKVISRTTMTNGGNNSATGAASMKAYAAAGFVPIPGFQLRYIYFLNPKAKERLTVPILPFSKIDEMGAGMYKGESKKSVLSETSDTPDLQSGKGGATPTNMLHSPDQ
tara:strand:+ start:333 stop:1160 length:828 start_codon:yes stop_codon:yes gene_type:complete